MTLRESMGQPFNNGELTWSEADAWLRDNPGATAYRAKWWYNQGSVVVVYYRDGTHLHLDKCDGNIPVPIKLTQKDVEAADWYIHGP